MSDIQTWTDRGKDAGGRLIGGDIYAICDQEPCTNHIMRSEKRICGGTFDELPHCGAFLCDEHLTEHETKHGVDHAETHTKRAEK